MAPAFGLAIQVDSFRTHKINLKQVIEFRGFVRGR
jgi:hypothetical protein